jgi:hypothetical protein
MPSKPLENRDGVRSANEFLYGFGDEPSMARGGDIPAGISDGIPERR